MPQFVDIKLRNIDYRVREFADRLHQHALVIQALAHREIFSPRMRPPGFALPPEQRLPIRLAQHQEDRVRAAVCGSTAGPAHPQPPKKPQGEWDAPAASASTSLVVFPVANPRAHPR